MNTNTITTTDMPWHIAHADHRAQLPMVADMFGHTAQISLYDSGDVHIEVDFGGTVRGIADGSRFTITTIPQSIAEEVAAMADVLAERIGAAA